MPGLGLGLEMPKMIDGSSSLGIIDKLGGVVKSGFVLGFSYHLLTRDYKGYCLRVRRASDDTTLDIGFVGGYIDYASINAFCAGTNGFVAIYYNQYSAGNDAIQATLASQLKIYDSVTGFINDGPKLDGTDDRFTIIKYVNIDIVSPKISFYLNIKNVALNGYIYCLNGSGYPEIQHGVYKVPDEFRFYSEGSLRIAKDNSNVPLMLTWNSININDFKFIDSNSSINTTFNLTLTSRNNVNIGCRSSNADNSIGESFGSGNLKTLIIFNTNRYADYVLISSLV